MPHSPGYKVLCVEDNVANLTLVEHILHARPRFTVLPALDGASALRIARSHVPDLVLLDLNLPDVSGEEVLARLKADPRTRGAPVVILTADGAAGTAERLLAHGALMHLTKPIEVDSLLRAVDLAMARPDAAAA